MPSASLMIHSNCANQLLAALPPDVFERIQSKLSIVPLKLKSILHTAGVPSATCTFPAAASARS